MKIVFTVIFVVAFFDIALLPFNAIAHQPRIVETEKVVVTDPEISKAYYGVLSDHPHLFFIDAKSSFNLYVNVLVPFIEGPGKNVSVEIFKDDQFLVSLSPEDEDWKEFFEPFGYSKYWQGPEFKKPAEAGKYKILVQSGEKNIRYVLAIGEIEEFDAKEGLNAILLIPELKKNFFEESPFSFILSPLGWGYVFLLQLLAMLIGWVLWRISMRSRLKTPRNNYQKSSRKIIIFCVMLWLSMLSWAVGTSWHPILILISGLALFAALISWREIKVSAQ